MVSVGVSYELHAFLCCDVIFFQQMAFYYLIFISIINGIYITEIHIADPIHKIQ
jgi:hypothetical protein